jgi:predicted transcriptional regulator
MYHRTRKCPTPATCIRQWYVVVTNTGDSKPMAENRETCVSEVLTFRVSGEWQAKFRRLCEATQQPKSIVRRQVLQVVNVVQLRQALQESRVEQAEREAS